MGSWREGLRRGSFGRALGGISALALALRVTHVVTFSDRLNVGLDSVWYQLVSGTIAGNEGFIDPERFYLHGVSKPTAFRPPLYPLFLAGVNKTVGETTRTFQLAGCVAGVLTVVLIGYLGRR